MQDKLQELTGKIYSEGVEKARKEADIILKEAQNRADAIEKEAQKKADAAIDEAEKQAETLKKNVESELKMSINQAITALKQDMASLITTKAVQPGVKELFSNADFLKSIVEKVVKAMAQEEKLDLKLILSQTERAELDAAFKKQLADELNKGLELEYADGVKNGFKVGPASGGYIVSFTDQDFINYFKAYLRPKTSELLFENQK